MTFEKEKAKSIVAKIMKARGSTQLSLVDKLCAKICVEEMIWAVDGSLEEGMIASLKQIEYEIENMQ